MTAHSVMSSMHYTSPAIENVEDLIFGAAPHPRRHVDRRRHGFSRVQYDLPEDEGGFISNQLALADPDKFLPGEYAL